MSEIVDDTSAAPPTTTRRWHARRTRGALTGLGLMLLGAWGAVIPFVGPYFDYSYSPDTTWTWTAARGYLEVAPGAVTFVAGLVLLMTRNRFVGVAAGWSAIVAGAWFVVGPLLAPLWDANALGRPTGGARDIALQQIGIFFGLGGAIMLLAGIAVGRFSMPDPRASTVVTDRRHTRQTERGAAEDETEDSHHHFLRRHSHAA